jgi:hypothetical protein
MPAHYLKIKIGQAFNAIAYHRTVNDWFPNYFCYGKISNTCITRFKNIQCTVFVSTVEVAYFNSVMLGVD